MFSKLREKLKSSLSIFSRKAKEEVEQPVEEQKTEPVAEKVEVTKVAVEEKKAETKVEPAKVEQIKIESPKKPAKEEKKSKVKEPKIIEQKKAEKPADKHPGMICDDKKGICIPAELAQPKTEKKIEPKAEPKVEKKAEQKIEPKTQPKIEPKVEPTESKVEEPKKSFFSRAKEFLTTKSLSEQQFDELFWSLERALLENNVAFDVVSKIKEDLKVKLINKPLPRDLESVVQNSLKESIDGILTTQSVDLLGMTSKKPLVIAFFGINGSGKTTTIAKVAHFFQQNNKTCVLAAGDTFRAAAIQQLEEHAANLNIKIIKHNYGADAAAVAFDAVKFAQKNNVDVVLIDTAGRLHSDSNLMDELKKIVKVSKPDLKIFIGESITGNDCIEQAQKFDELIGIDGLILTKADVDEKGGTALSISYVTNKPILYIGMGQNYGDLKPFSKELVLEHLGLA